MNDPCAICQDTITKATGIVTLSCSHSYHLSCIVTWFMTQDKGSCPYCRKEVGSLEDIHKTVEANEDEEEPLEDSIGLTNLELSDIIWGLGGYPPRTLLEDDDGVVYYIYNGIEMYLNSYSANPMTNEEWVLRVRMQTQWPIPFPEDVWKVWRIIHAEDLHEGDRFILTCEAIGPLQDPNYYEPNYLIRVINYLHEMTLLHDAINLPYSAELRSIIAKIDDYIQKNQKKNLHVTFSTDNSSDQRVIAESTSSFPLP